MSFRFRHDIEAPAAVGCRGDQALEGASFAYVSTKGSHAKLRNAEGRTVIVPRHSELARGTLSSVLRQAGLTVEQFVDLLN